MVLLLSATQGGERDPQKQTPGKKAVAAKSRKGKKNWYKNVPHENRIQFSTVKKNRL